MPLFQYTGTDPAGRPTQGTVYGASLESVLKDLSSKGFQITQAGLSVDEPPPAARPESPRMEAPPVEYRAVDENTVPPELEERPKFVTGVVGPLAASVPLSVLTFFFRQASTMLEAGVGPHDTFSTLARQRGLGPIKSILDEAARNAMAGHPLSATLQRYPETFTPMMLSVLRAGEQGGFMGASMGQIADYLDREIELRNLIRRVTIYPKLVLGASVIVIFAANQIIASLAPDSKIRLTSPLTNPAFWVVMIPVLIIGFVVFRIAGANSRYQFNRDQILRAVPGFSGLHIKFSTAKFGVALGTLYRAGIPIRQAIGLASDASGSEYVRSKIHEKLPMLEAGLGITDTLRASGVFNDIVLNMCDTGERTGNLDLMLDKLSKYYEEEATTRSIQMAYLLGVVMLLVVGAYVGYIYISNLAGIGDTYREAADGAASWILL